MKRYVKIYSLDYFDNLSYVHLDYNYNYCHNHKFSYIKHCHIGKIINLFDYQFYVPNNPRELDWAIEKELTIEEYPEYYL